MRLSAGPRAPATAREGEDAAWAEREEMLVSRLTLAALILALAMALPGCASYQRSQGVANLWRDSSVPPPVKGQTTESEIIQALGPPSQIIGLGDQTVFYYLTERRKGKVAILLLFNWLEEDTSYDRAIFFFDEKGVLQEYGFSKETISPSH